MEDRIINRLTDHNDVQNNLQEEKSRRRSYVAPAVLANVAFEVLAMSCGKKETCGPFAEFS